MAKIFTQKEIESLLEVIEEDNINYKNLIKELKEYIFYKDGKTKKHKVTLFLINNNQRQLFVLKIFSKLSSKFLREKIIHFFEEKKYKIIDIKIEKEQNIEEDKLEIHIDWTECFDIMKDVKVGKIYRHWYKNGEYFVLDFCNIQINSDWKKAVIYQKVNSNKKFVRELEDFKNKFLTRR